MTKFPALPLLLLGLGMMCTGCSSTYQAYPGPALVASQVATVRFNRWVDALGNANLWPNSIDSVPVKNRPNEVTLLSGDHTFELGGMISPNGTTVGTMAPYTGKVHVSAGCNYRFYIESPWNPVIIFAKESD